MLNIPNIQQAMSVFVAEELSEVLNTKVVIGRINMGLLNRIIIDDVLLDDQSGQEMLKVTRLSAKFDIMPFFKGKISISRDRKSTRLNSSHRSQSRMPSSA